MIDITEVRVLPLSPRDASDQLRAFVAITLSHTFVVRNLKVIQGPQGLFVAMPSRKDADGQFRDLAHPINHETRVYLTRAVLDAYRLELAKQVTA